MSENENATKARENKNLKGARPDNTKSIIPYSDEI